MDIDMSNELNFPIKYNYEYINAGDFIDEDAPELTNLQLFYAYSQSTLITPMFETSKVYKMRNTFAGCEQLQFVVGFDTSNVVDMANAFATCYDLIEAPNFNTSKVENMAVMFQSCYKLKTIPSYDTSKVTNMYAMFHSCLDLISIPHLDTSKVTDMSYMFYNCNNLNSIPQLDASNVADITNIFYGDYGNLFNFTDLGGFKDLGKQSSVAGINIRFLDNTPYLTHESLMNVINNLYDRKSNGLSNLSVKFGTKNLNKLTDEEKAIAVNKGWALT